MLLVKKKGYAHRRGLMKGPLIAEARGHLPILLVIILSRQLSNFCGYYFVTVVEHNLIV